MLDVIAIGEVLIDFTPAGRSTGGNEQFECNPGGAPANVAAALSRLGARTALISKVGEDQFGSLLYRTLQDSGVDVSEISVTNEASTTLAFVHLDEQGDRTFSFFRKPGADTFLDAKDVPLGLIESSRLLHYGSLSLTHEPARTATRTAVLKAKEAGVLLSFDPNIRFALWESKEEAKQQIFWGLKYADILKISEEELFFITGTSEVEKGSLELQKRFDIMLIVVTLAEKGCYYRLAGQDGYVPGFKVKAIDTTGAGDAFLGCLLSKLLENENSLHDLTSQQMTSILTFANAGGALVTTRKGALGSMPTTDEINQMIDSNPQDIADCYRPGFHFSPPTGWANDPNGLVYCEGSYHLFYQNHPYSNKWGPMHWGHAISKDLIHWEHAPIALYPDEHGAIFSGCCVVDWKNSSGLFGDSYGLVAIFTHADSNPVTGQPRQRQSLAYSSDKGETWHKYEGNPVLAEDELIDFRDPKVFWHPQSARWIMVIVAGDHARFYESANLLEWSLTGKFGSGEGSHDGVWECPDLFALPVDDTGRSKWVLIISIGDHPDCPEGSRTQYFIGEFDGNTFINDNPADHILWLDYGRDNYAGVTWSDIPEQDGRRVIIGWMSNWKYANETPTGSWRGAMTLPRALSLTSKDGSVVLTQMPVREVARLRNESLSWEAITVTPEVPFKQETNNDLIEIEAEIDVRSGEEVQLQLKSSGQSVIVIGYDPAKEWLSIDRSKSGVTDFHPEFGCKHSARIAAVNGQLKLHIWLDRNSVEVYANHGLVVLTDQVFPDAPIEKVEISTKSGQIVLDSLQIHTLHSIHIPAGITTQTEGRNEA
ncbi:PfkB family carbohydrate kinase [Paenibacillus sp. MMS20-IR301]|uniref:PfkB family carbohydrate kinase n=1 Tax=Paenibacillus sp. MMS20-IR301 TaxID=2895946 RepID=UPI0028E357A9|nr:PfkB family carbohydrate kinase [Paenibacillus sp. MMS20-IR301]WNS43613.1 PfkB family carbohydrate kinase [Paenibacillus sp. MMS20-IR301]